MDEPGWDHYRSFLAVIDHGSLSAAARELGLTQPTIGRHIALLEEALGHPLFSRSSSGLLPTEQAEALVPHARGMAHAAAALQRTASGMAGKVEGTVRISASEIVGVEVLPFLLAPLQVLHPGLEFELSARDEVEDLLRRQADIAVRMTEPKQEALLARFIGNIALRFHAHRDYLARYGMPKHMGDLKDHKLVGFDRQRAYLRAMMKRFPEAADAHFSFRADSNLAQFAAIRAGLGIGICQVELARRHPELVPVLPGFSMPLPTWVVMHEDLKTSPRCRAVFDALCDGLKRQVG